MSPTEKRLVRCCNRCRAADVPPGLFGRPLTFAVKKASSPCVVVCRYAVAMYIWLRNCAAGGAFSTTSVEIRIPYCWPTRLARLSCYCCVGPAAAAMLTAPAAGNWCLAVCMFMLLLLLLRLRCQRQPLPPSSGGDLQTRNVRRRLYSYMSGSSPRCNCSSEKAGSARSRDNALQLTSV